MTVKKPQRTKLDWWVHWKKPSVDPNQACVYGAYLDEAEHQLATVVKRAVHHAAVMGEASLTIHVKRGRVAVPPRKEPRHHATAQPSPRDGTPPAPSANGEREAEGAGPILGSESNSAHPDAAE